MLSSYTLETGILMTGTLGSVNPSVSGNTSPLVVNGKFASSGYGEVYGFFFDASHISFGLSPHNRSVTAPPSPTGTVYYPSLPDFGGSGIQLRFLITAYSGYGEGVYQTGGMTDAGVFVGSPFLIGLNGSGYSGLNNSAMPSGYLLHFESRQLLPDYAFATSDALTGAHPYFIQAGGIYPSMLRDNILSINLQMTWSGSCGDAINC